MGRNRADWIVGGVLHAGAGRLAKLAGGTLLIGLGVRLALMRD